MTSETSAFLPSPLPGAARPLVVTSDPELLDELLRLCGAAGCPPLVASDPAALRRAWSTASLVLLGGDLASVARDLPPRPRLVLVGSPGDSLWSVAADVGAEHVAVLPAAGPWLLGLLTAQDPPAGRQGGVVCVIGGQGGAGATTLAAALGRGCAAGGSATLLIDADPFGGGLDLALGMEAAAGDRWPQVLSPGDASSRPEPTFLDHLPARGALRLLAMDRDAPAELNDSGLTAVLAAAGSRTELIIVDLPRRIDPVTRVALERADCVYLVVPAQVRAVAAAAQLARALRELQLPVRAVVRGPAPGGLALEAVQRSLAIPLAAAVKAEPGLDRDYERGVPPGQPKGPLARLCTELLGQLRAAGVCGLAASSTAA